MRQGFRALLGLDDDGDDRLGEFVSQRLFEAGVWPSPRTSDGVLYVRTVEDEVDTMRLCGLIYRIEQTVHAFWLELAAGTSPGEVAWSLWFELVGGSAQKQRNAIDLASRTDELEWEVALAGTARIEDGAIIAVEQP
jgi:hypothetical protein